MGTSERKSDVPIRRLCDVFHFLRRALFCQRGQTPITFMPLQGCFCFSTEQLNWGKWSSVPSFDPNVPDHVGQKQPGSGYDVPQSRGGMARCFGKLVEAPMTASVRSTNRHGVHLHFSLRRRRAAL